MIIPPQEAEARGSLKERYLAIKTSLFGKKR